MKKLIALITLAIVAVTFIPAIAGWWDGGEMTIRSVELNDNGEIVVIKTQSAGWAYPEGGGPPDNAWRYTYAAKDGKIYLKKTEQGLYYPSYDTRVAVPEKYKFNQTHK